MLRSAATRWPSAAAGLGGAASALELVTSRWVCDAAGVGELPTAVVGGTVAGTAGGGGASGAVAADVVLAAEDIGVATAGRAPQATPSAAIVAATIQRDGRLGSDILGTILSTIMASRLDRPRRGRPTPGSHVCRRQGVGSYHSDPVAWRQLPAPERCPRLRSEEPGCLARSHGTPPPLPDERRRLRSGGTDSRSGRHPHAPTGRRAVSQPHEKASPMWLATRTRLS
jgi:hypothetical protein